MYLNSAMVKSVIKDSRNLGDDGNTSSSVVRPRKSYIPAQH